MNNILQKIEEKSGKILSIFILFFIAIFSLLALWKYRNFFYNAMDLVDAGCAEIIYDWDLTGERIAERIKFFMNHPEELAKRSQIAKTLARPMAASDVLEESLNMLSPV